MSFLVEPVDIADHIDFQILNESCIPGIGLLGHTRENEGHGGTLNVSEGTEVHLERRPTV